MPFVDVVLGGLLLLFGRSLYWVFVAVAGFLVGGQVAELALADSAPWIRLLAAIAAGLIGALLAMLAQRLAFGLAGFYAGGYLTAAAMNSLQVDGNSGIWLLAGAILGALVALVVLDWAIIVLSSLVGASAIVAALNLAPTAAAIGMLLLVAIGIAVQGRRLQAARANSSLPGP